MRLFIAINFHEETRLKLKDIQRLMRASAPRGRFPDPETFHLTLAFLGECDENQLHAARDILSLMAFEPFELTFERIGRFMRRDGDLWWTGIALTRELKELQENLTNALISVGFALDTRPFNPHVTLARRIVEKIDVPALRPFSEVVRTIELMESTRINSRLTYRPIFRIESR